MASFARPTSSRARGLRTVLVAAVLVAACAGGRGPAAPAPGSKELAAAGALANRPDLLVLIAIPGLVPEHYLPAPGTPAAAPQLATLAEAGIAVEAVQPVFPATTLPALVSLVTGRGPAAHGVMMGGEPGPNGIERPLAVPASAIRTGTLWQAVAAAGVAVAAFDWPATAGTTIAQALPAGAAGADTTTPGAARDAAIADAACALLASPSPPSLLLLRLAQAEVVRDTAPPGSNAALRAIAGADAEVGRIVACLSRAGRLASSAIVVTGDHGTLPVHSTILPNARLAEVGLVTLERGRRVLSWQAMARSNGGTAFVYARSAEEALLARRALEESARATGAFRVVSAQELLARDADPEAWFGLDAAPGWIFDEGFAGLLIGPALQRAAGGYAPGEPRMATGLVAFGAGLRPRVRVPEMRQIDVAPTLARLLGVALPDADGQALFGVLEP